MGGRRRRKAQRPERRPSRPSGRPGPWRLATIALVVVGAALAALLPRRVDLIVDNSLGVPLSVDIDGRAEFVGPRSAKKVTGVAAGSVRLVARGPDGQEKAALDGYVPACLAGGPGTWVWDVAGQGGYWTVERAYERRPGTLEPGLPRPLETGGALFPLPADVVQSLDEFPREVREEGILVAVVTPRLLRAPPVPHGDPDPSVGSAWLSLRARYGLEVTIGAALGGLLGLLARWARRELRKPAPAERPIAAGRWLGALFIVHVLLLLPLGRFARWVPPESFTGFYSFMDHEVHDEGGHLAYFPSLLRDGDVDVWNGDERLFYVGLEPTATGRGTEYWTLGTPLYWAPFQLGAHALTGAAAAAGIEGAAPDGASKPYVAAAALGSAAAVLLAAWACFAIGRRVADPRSALCAAALVAFSTPLPFYGFVRTRLDHAVEAFAIALAVWGWLRLRERPLDRAADALLGLAWGFAATTRQSNVVLLLGPGLDGLLMLWEAKDAAARRALLGRAAAFALGFAPFALLHLTLLQTLWGVPWSAGHEGHFDWPSSTAYRLWRMFFGGWGLFLQSPVWALALAGYGLLLRDRATRRTAALCLVQLGALFLVAFLFSEERLGGYAFRTLLGAAPFLAFGAARLLSAIPPQLRGKALLALAGPLIAWAYLQVVQHPILIGHETRDYVFEAAKNVPDLFGSPFLLRSTCWPRAIWLADVSELAARDLIFLAFVPAVFVAVPLGLLALLRRLAAGAADGERLSRPLRRTTAAVLALLLLLELLLLSGARSLPTPTIADRLLASARRTIDDPCMLLRDLGTPEQRVDRWLARAETLAPDHPDLPWTRALRAAAWGDGAAALPALEAERARRPDSSSAAWGVALALRGNQARAADRLAAIVRAAELDPGQLRARWEAIGLLRQAGQTELADRMLDEAARLAWHHSQQEALARQREAR